MGAYKRHHEEYRASLGERSCSSECIWGLACRRAEGLDEMRVIAETRLGGDIRNAFICSTKE